MEILIKNISLVSVGIAIICMGILAFIIILQNHRSWTNRIFFVFAFITAIWSALNYLSFQSNDPLLILWILRLVIFLGVWHAFSIFTLFYIFPKEKIKFSKSYKFILAPLSIIISSLALTPLIFSRIEEMLPGGGAAKVINGPLMPIFGLTIISLIASGFWLLIKKVIKSTGIEKKQFILVFTGAISFFSLLLIYNFIMPAFFDNPNLIPLSAIFIFPFIGFTAYAIIKYNLFNIKIIATELLVFTIWIAILIDLLVQKTSLGYILKSGEFLFIIIFGIFLIRSVIKEVRQREELEKLANELKISNQKLVKTDKMKSAMYSFVSHQIKAPMGIIKGFISLLLGGDYGEIPQKAKETMQIIKDSNDRLLKLVEDFLDLRKIEERKIDYNFQQINIVDLTKNVIEELKPLAEQKKLKLSLDCSLPDIKIKADEIRLRQVIFNLIENSIKYTPEGFIKIDLRQITNNEQRGVLFSAKDSGIGISQDALPHLFDEFVRAQTEQVRHIKGTGLGLYIAKQIIEAHQGKIWAESKGESNGSIFYIKLPIG